MTRRVRQDRTPFAVPRAATSSGDAAEGQWLHQPAVEPGTSGARSWACDSRSPSQPATDSWPCLPAVREMYSGSGRGRGPSQDPSRGQCRKPRSVMWPTSLGGAERVSPGHRLPQPGGHRASSGGHPAMLPVGRSRPSTPARPALCKAQPWAHPRSPMHPEASLLSPGTLCSLRPPSCWEFGGDARGGGQLSCPASCSNARSKQEH